MIKKILAASVLSYFVSEGMWVFAESLEEPCKGWECEQVQCPDGYAVKIKDKGYLPCENFDEYIKTENKELLR